MMKVGSSQESSNRQTVSDSNACETNCKYSHITTRHAYCAPRADVGGDSRIQTEIFAHEERHAAKTLAASIIIYIKSVLFHSVLRCKFYYWPNILCIKKHNKQTSKQMKWKWLKWFWVSETDVCVCVWVGSQSSVRLELNTEKRVNFIQKGDWKDTLLVTKATKVRNVLYVIFVFLAPVSAVIWFVSFTCCCLMSLRTLYLCIYTKCLYEWNSASQVEILTVKENI